MAEILGAPSRENTRVKSIKITWDFASQVILLPITLAIRFKPKFLIFSSYLNIQVFYDIEKHDIIFMHFFIELLVYFVFQTHIQKAIITIIIKMSAVLIAILHL